MEGVLTPSGDTACSVCWAGWGTWIRTKTKRVRATRSTVKLFPNGGASKTLETNGAGSSTRRLR